MSKKKPPNVISPEEIEEFQSHLRGTRRLSQNQVILRPKSTAAKPKISAHKVAPAIEDFAEWISESEQVDADTILNFGRSGLQHKVLRKLRQDQFIPDAELDLHGLTLNKARVILRNFLQQAQRNQQRWLRIIHGKGARGTDKPVLKNYVNFWLRQHPLVLAFHSANRQSGGTGAVNVLIKLSQGKVIDEK